MSRKRLYIIGNSHMDPIWLWRMREGRSTWLNTCRSVVNMMKKYPFLKFSRSSSACYRWIEESDPQLFREIQKLVEQNRWELVGGWVEQSDTIITPGESLLRQAEHAKKYFKDKFGKEVHVAYSVDSFGHNIGLPKILKETGFDCYAWMRPDRFEKTMPDRFRWRCDDKSGDILSFRIQGGYQTGPYLKEHKDFIEHLEDGVLGVGDTDDQTFFFGIGDHGGGFYEKQLNWLLDLEEKYDLIFSSLEDYFKIMEKEDLPVLEEEHVHHAPGCYSATSAIKHWMSDTEKSLYKAEKITLQGNWHDREKNVAALTDAWEEVLFNYFHDVYPGTSIRSAYEHEIRDINGYANHQANTILEQGLSRIASTINTNFLTEGGVLLWNSLSAPVMGRGHYDTFSDPNYSGTKFNCLIDEKGNTIPLQWLNAESGLNLFHCWGKAVFTTPMKASQAKAFAFGRCEEFTEKVGYERQKKLLERIRFQIIDDKGDTWGHRMKELGPTLGDAELVEVTELNDGPVVSLVRAEYKWKNSKFELKLYAWKDIEEIEAEFYADWQERKETLKICLKTGRKEADVLSGQIATSIRRTPDICEQPFIDFVSIDGNGFMAEYFHSYDSIGSGELRLTLIRPIVYTQETARGDEGYADIGQLWHKFWIFTDSEKEVEKLEAKARALLWGCEHLEITRAADGRTYQLDEYELVPEFVTVSCSRINPDQSREFHLYNPCDQEITAEIYYNGRIAASQKLMPRAFKKVIF